MMQWPRILIMVFVAWALAGCGAVDKIRGKPKIAETPPSPLTDIEQSIEVKQNWSFDLGGGASISSLQLVPALLGDTVFAASPKGSVFAIDTASGKKKWHTNLDSSISGAVGVGDNVVLIGTPDGVVVALAAESGDRIWSQQLSSEILAPPGADSGVAVVRTVDGHVYGLSSVDGEKKWVLRRQVPTLTLRGNSPPLVVLGAAIVGFANGKVVAADLSDGSIIWDIAVAQPRGRNEVERMIDIDSTPILVGSVLYISAFQGAVTALALGSRRILWSKDISSYTHINADEDNIYVSDDLGIVRALDRLSGETKWEQTGLKRRTLSGPTAVGDHVLVSDYEGYLHVLKKTDGRLVGRRKIDELAGLPVVHNGNVYAMTEGGKLVSISLVGTP